MGRARRREGWCHSQPLGEGPGPRCPTLHSHLGGCRLVSALDREGNGHDFGRLMIAMGFHVNLSKAQAETIAKNTRKKQNEQI